MSNFVRNNGNGNQQFNQQNQQNFNGNGNNFQGHNASNIQAQRQSTVPQSNDWDQFFQQSNVGSANIGGNSGSLNGNQFNNQQQQHSTSGSNYQQSMVNDLAASQLLRNNFQQSNNNNSMSSGQSNNGLVIDQSMKQSLARTVGLSLPNSMINNNFNNGTGVSNNFQQNSGGNNNRSNLGGSQQQNQFSGRIVNNNNNNNNSQIQQNGSSGGDSRFPSTQQLLLLQQQQMMQRRGGNNNNDNGNFNDQLDDSFDSFNGGGNGNFQQQRNNNNNNNNSNNSQRFNNNNDFNDSSFSGNGGSGGYDSGAHLNSNNNSQQQQHNAPNPLSVLSKLNSIVAVTGGGLSAAQLQRAMQNPLVGVKMPAASSLQQPQRNFQNSTNGGGGGGGVPNMLPSGLNRVANNSNSNNFNGNVVNGGANKRPALEVLPGDVRYRGPNTTNGQQQQQQFFDSNNQQGSNIRQHTLGGSGNQQNNRAQQQQQSYQQSSGVDGGNYNNRGNNNNNNLMNNNFNNNAVASVILRDNQTFNNGGNNNNNNHHQGQQQQSNVNGNNNLVRNTKWVANQMDTSQDFIHSHNNSNSNNSDLLSSPLSSGMNSGGVRKIAKGGFPGTTNSLSALSFSTLSGKRDRSASPEYSRHSRSRSPSRDNYYSNNNINNNTSINKQYQQNNNLNNVNNKRGGGGGRGGPAGGLTAGGRGDKRNNTRSPPRNANNSRYVNNPTLGNNQPSGPAASAVGRRGDLDYTTLPPHQLIDQFNAPSIPKTQHLLTAVDLYAKFPNLYVPADFVSLEVDWKSITASMYNDKICDLTVSVPMQFENLPAAMEPISTASESAVASAVDHDSSAPAVISGLEVPKYTYLSASTCNNRIMDGGTNYSRFHVTTTRPVKFNAKVVVSCGVQNHANERIDQHLPRKLRLLCGRRKGQIMLLGSAWCRELDGGNPMEDRSCLLNTARRAVYAQSLLDIFNPAGTSDENGHSQFDVTSNLTKLCEVNYHRPKEEINGKLYPEQEEITVIYLYTMQSDALPLNEQDADASFQVFKGRVSGQSVGPVINMNVDHFHEENVNRSLQNKEEVTDATKDSVSEEDVSVPQSAPIEVEAVPTEVLLRDDNASMEQSPAEEDVVVMESVVKSAEAVEVAGVVTEDVASGAAESKEEMKEGSVSVPPIGKAIPVKVEVVKPSVPTIFLCPTPLPQSVQDDFSQRQEAVTLRLMPLSAVLSYSPDDCSERIFEASVGGEFVRSLVALSNANIIADFLLAENPSLASLADVRVVQAVKKLRQMGDAIKNKTLTLAVPAVASVVSTTLESTSPAVKNSPAAVEIKTELEENAPVVMEEQSDAQIADTDDLVPVEASETVGEAAQPQSPSVTKEQHPEVEGEEDPFAYQISEDEARMWRRRFVAACRWFDPEQERALSRDVVQLVFHYSTRNLSRVDVTTATDTVCRAGRVSYETHI